MTTVKWPQLWVLERRKDRKPGTLESHCVEQTELPSVGESSWSQAPLVRAAMSDRDLFIKANVQGEQRDTGSERNSRHSSRPAWRV